MGFKAVVTCIDQDVMDNKFVGREYGRDFLNELPKDIDPCGENGEFHSFVFDGPIFNEKIDYKRGETVLKNDRFCFCDLVPDEEACSEGKQEVSASKV
jgi:diphthamide synthase (EF-2-diphthine--ammonia ligase)